MSLKFNRSTFNNYNAVKRYKSTGLFRIKIETKANISKARIYLKSFKQHNNFMEYERKEI